MLRLIKDTLTTQVVTLWRVFVHAFAKTDTVEYPDVQPQMAARWRGRIILSRDPDGEERCVACNLCAVACPVDCIALQKTEDEEGALVSRVLPDQLLALHHVWLLRRSLSYQCNSTDP